MLVLAAYAQPKSIIESRWRFAFAPLRSDEAADKPPSKITVVRSKAQD
jgi:hypothetical protein